MDLMKSLNDFISLEAWKLLKKPNMVFSHFANRFDKCHEYRVHIDSQFPNISSMDQVEELEREVTYDEVKKAMWYKEVDIEKARDSVRWDYVDDILHKDGFGDKWRMWIKGRLYSSIGPVLLNGSPSRILIFQRIKTRRSIIPVLVHSVYVGEWNDSNLCTIVHVVKCFFLASGLKISDGEFSVKSVRNLFDDSLLSSNGSPTRWVKEIPFKINAFAWRVQQDRLPTQLNLSRRGIDI
ncbi:RNA-directed DNA polymerase, eukaryota [Tanacetum coccineum]